MIWSWVRLRARARFVPSSLALTSLAPAKSVRLSKAWLKSALVRLALSSLASVKSAPERSAPARFAPESVAKRNDAPRSRAEARLTGPPFMMPICRSAALKESLMRLGTVAGFCRRQSFHNRGPRRKTSTCSESANTVSGRKWRKMAPVFAEGGYLDCVTPREARSYAWVFTPCYYALVESLSMSDTADLTVRVLDDRDIVVAGPEFEVTYRREGHLGMLVATDALRERLTASKARFLAQAWKAAYKKARTLGWLSS